eukprot:115796-Chlamydomonas_euryale.AAC.1
MIPDACMAAVTVGTCVLAADKPAVNAVLPSFFSVTRRCVDGTQKTCKSVLVPPAMPSPVPSLMPNP